MSDRQSRVITPGRAVPRTLRELRIERGLSLRETAALTGLHRGVISQIERGRLVARADEMRALQEAIGLPLETRVMLVSDVTS